jgi:phage repressor protein C with HTH and peptisase S24 domain/DNA-binding Xre family transcriptional regulator
MEVFCQKIAEIKKRRGLTTKELSQMCGIPLGTLNKLLSGVIEEPKLSTAVAICSALGVTLGALTGEAPDIPMSDDERKLLHDYREADSYGRALVRQVAEMESGRTADSREGTEDKAVRTTEADREGAVITLPLYLMPVSAGTGAVLDGSYAQTIDVRASFATEQADFALRVSGNSMEPRFKSGDIVLVHQQNNVLFGELGIFIADGEGYFKRYMGDRLHSLNPEYPDIPLRRFEEFICCGKVVGHMKKKS